jgi:hypothetical protein
MKKSVTIVLFLLTAFFAGQRARAASAAGGEGPFFPGSGMVLQDGDILLTYVPSLLNSCNRTSPSLKANTRTLWFMSNCRIKGEGWLIFPPTG